MSDLQKYFDKLFDLLESETISNPLVEECLGIKEHELSFSSFEKSNMVEKKHILKIYKDRYGYEKETRLKNPFVIGYDTLLPVLESIELDFINVSSLTNEAGTYVIFSDYEYNCFVGILKSKRTLLEKRDLMKRNEKYEEISFLNGKLK